MNLKSRNSALSWRRLGALALACALATSARSQSTTTSPANPAATPSNAAGTQTAANTSDEDIVQLSPFEVVEEEHNGYYSSNTAAGTRLNSRIDDLGASITVVTKQQLEDTASIDINDVFLFEANTEGTEQFTDFGVDRNGAVDDRIQRAPESANRIRGMGAANISRGAFNTSNRVPLDTYNIDSIEISRGPNSTLSGLGAASGTVNINVAKANPQRSSTNVTFRADSFGGWRSSFDLNRPLIKDKLAVRFSALHEMKGFRLKPSEEKTDRAFFAVTYRPFHSTTIRGSFESYWNYRRRPNSITPRDGVSDWIAHGMPTWDPVTASATVNGVTTGPIPVGRNSTAENNAGRLPEGLFGDGTLYTRPSMYIEDGQVALWTVNRTGNADPNSPNTDLRYLISTSDISRYRGSLYPLFTAQGVSDKSLYDYDSINFVAGNWSRAWADTSTIELEQRLAPKLYLQLGWFHEDDKSYDRNVINTSSTLLVDVNERLLDGTPNPYFKRAYLQVAEPSYFKRPQLNNSYRASLAGELDFSHNENKWLSLLGKHRAVAYAESRNITDGTYRFREAVLDNHWYLSTTNRTNGSAAARATYRYYLGDDQGFNVDFAPTIPTIAGTHDFRYLDPRSDPDVWTSETSYFGEAPYVSGRTQRAIHTWGAGLQSFFWKDRIIATVGYRKDKNNSRASLGAATDPATGLYTYDNLSIWQDWQKLEGATKQYGVVVKPLSWLGVYYNFSDSFEPAEAGIDLFGNLLPNPTGEGRDYGITFNIYKTKVVGRINLYKSKAINSRNGDAGIVATRAQRLDFGGDRFNLQDQATTWTTTLHPDWTDDQIQHAVYDTMQLPFGFIENLQGKTADVSDVTSKGAEIELNVNPDDFLTFKLTVGKQETINSAISPKIQQYLETRLPIWQSIIDPVTGENWWTEGSQSAEAFYESAVLVPLHVAIAQQGKPKPQVRKWHVTTLMKYALAGITDNRFFSRLQIGGSVRWDSKGSIGFFGDPDPDGVMRDLDVNKPIWDKARASADLFASYGFRMFEDKVSARLQLNVRNVFENGELRTISVNPDGSPSQFRIIDPRQFIFTASFDL